jgi:prenylcysteine alpha-carboxyl methylesterase
VQGFLALSSLFNMSTMQAHFERRGMSKGMVQGIFGEDAQNCKPVAFTQYSPYHYFNEELPKKRLPKTLLMHGTADDTVPSSESEGFKQALLKHGVDVQLKLYEGATHTSKLLEDPMRGGKDDVVADVLEFMKLDGTEEAEFWPMLPFPRITSALAGLACPF